MAEPENHDKDINSIRSIIESGLRSRKQNERTVQQELECLDDFVDWIQRRFYGFWHLLRCEAKVEPVDLRKLVLTAQKDARSIAQQGQWLGFIVDICRWGELHWGWTNAREQAVKVLPAEQSEWSFADVKQLQIALEFEYAIQTEFGTQASELGKVDPAVSILQFIVATGVTSLSWMERWLSKKAVNLHQKKGCAWLVYSDPETDETTRIILDAISMTAWLHLMTDMVNAKSNRIKSVIGRYLSSTGGNNRFPNNWKSCRSLVEGLMRVRQSALVAQLNTQCMSVVSLPEPVWRRNMLGVLTPLEKKVRRVRVNFDLVKGTNLGSQLRAFDQLKTDHGNRKNDAAFLDIYEAQLHYGTHDFRVAGSLILAWACQLVRFGGENKAVLADATIATYLGEVRWLIGRWHEVSSPEFEDPKALVTLFRLTYQGASEGQQRKILAMFFRFIEEQDLLPELDLSWLERRHGKVPVDANYLAPMHLDQMVDNLECGFMDPEQRLGAQVAAILGYYAMLRRGEVSRLRVNDVILGPFSELLIQRTPEGATKNRRSRRVRLNLLPGHQAILEKYIRIYCEGSQPDDPLLGGRAYNFFGRQRRYLIPVRDGMRQVTGDETLRYHHLRHSGASNLILQAALLLRWAVDPVDEEQGWFLNHLIFSPDYIKQRWESVAEQRDCSLVDPGSVLYVVAELLGHASPTTTLASYFHFPELLSALSQPLNRWLPRSLCRGLLGYSAQQTTYFSAQKAIVDEPDKRVADRFYCCDGSFHQYGKATDCFVDQLKLREKVLAGFPVYSIEQKGTVPDSAGTLTPHQWRPNTPDDLPWLGREGLLVVTRAPVSNVLDRDAEVEAWSEERFEWARKGLEILRPPHGWQLPGRQDTKAILKYLSGDSLPMSWIIVNRRQALAWKRIVNELPIPLHWWSVAWEAPSQQQDVAEWAYLFDPDVKVLRVGTDCPRTGQLNLSFKLPNRVSIDVVREGLRCWLIWLQYS